jgi:hypothetical protein
MTGLEDDFVDAEGRPLAVGSLVRDDDDRLAIVVGDTGWDGDVDETGAVVGIPPKLIVRYIGRSPAPMTGYITAHFTWSPEYVGAISAGECECTAVEHGPARAPAWQDDNDNAWTLEETP